MQRFFLLVCVLFLTVSCAKSKVKTNPSANAQVTTETSSSSTVTIPTESDTKATSPTTTPGFQSPSQGQFSFHGMSSLNSFEASGAASFNCANRAPGTYTESAAGFVYGFAWSGGGIGRERIYLDIEGQRWAGAVAQDLPPSVNGTGEVEADHASFTAFIPKGASYNVSVSHEYTLGGTASGARFCFLPFSP